MKFFLYLGTLFLFFYSNAQTIPAYKNPQLPVEDRVKDLISRMTIEEKFWQLFMIPGDMDNADSAQFKNGLFGFQVSAAAKNDAGGQMLNYSTSESAAVLLKKINAIQKYFTENTRLGIPLIFFDEALHGLVRDGATAFPQAIGLAASWDTALMQNVASAIADETKARGIRDVLSPVINIADDVRWGRVEETYGEDPFLAGRMAVAFVSAFENRNIITTPKHFIANAGDGGRDSYPIHRNERLLDEIYFPPFEEAIKHGHARSIMSSYNSLDGISCSSNNWLLMKKLKADWGFKGFVISDANAVGADVVLHYTAKDYADAGRNAINNGLDVIFQTSFDHYKLFITHFLDGTIDTNRINNAVARVLTAKFELGLFEHPYTSEDELQALMNKNNHQQLAKQAALESVVLLKNDGHTLPIGSNVRTIAVIGEEATAARLGGYSGPGNNKVDILTGIKQKAEKDIQVLYAPGAGIEYNEETVIDAQYLSGPGDAAGLQGEYFNNISLNGEPVITRNDKTIDFKWTLSPPHEKINPDFYSVRWTGKLHSPYSGNYKIGLEGNDGFRLYINDKLLIDNWKKESYNKKLCDFYFEKNKTCDIKVEFFEPAGNASIKLLWNEGADTDRDEKIKEAVAAAQQADMAIVVAGIHEGEFQDRAFLSLPGFQEDLILAVAATGKPVAVVLTGGSAITMQRWKDKVNSIVDVWYPGEQGGNAAADVLFGAYNPAGRLPVTFPLHESQLPLVYNHKPTGRGDDYYNLSGLPLFPFGFGLSYTNFSYSDIVITKNDIDKNDSATVTCTIQNTGAVAGDEVVQLYIHDMLASVARPVMELKGFQRIHLAPGELRHISFTITSGMLSMLNAQMQKVVEPGDFRIMIGASSRDIRLKETLRVKE